MADKKFSQFDNMTVLNGSEQLVGFTGTDNIKVDVDVLANYAVDPGRLTGPANIDGTEDVTVRESNGSLVSTSILKIGDWAVHPGRFQANDVPIDDANMMALSNTNGQVKQNTLVQLKEYITRFVLASKYPIEPPDYIQFYSNNELKTITFNDFVNSLSEIYHTLTKYHLGVFCITQTAANNPNLVEPGFGQLPFGGYTLERMSAGTFRIRLPYFASQPPYNDPSVSQLKVFISGIIHEITDISKDGSYLNITFKNVPSSTMVVGDGIYKAQVEIRYYIF